MSYLSSGSSKPIKLQDIETQFQSERREAEAWFEGVKANEQRWIEQGVDVVQQFLAAFEGERRDHHLAAAGQAFAQFAAQRSR